MSVSTSHQPQATAPTGRTGPRSRLHPAKVRAGLRRRWFQRRLEATPLSPADDLVGLGDLQYGGWVLPGGSIGADWICYSVGAGGDISFDIELITRYGATVRAVDPVASYVRLAIEEAAGDPHWSIRQAALAATDGPVRMQVTHDLDSESVSPAGLYDSHSYVEVPGLTLPSLMSGFGDSRVDLLKIDIEGGEYEVIPSLDLRALGVRVFATQLHHTGSVREARALVAGLAAQGYEAVACHPAVKIAFARRD
jgi:FkbM family methyltransferase